MRSVSLMKYLYILHLMYTYYTWNVEAMTLRRISQGTKSFDTILSLATLMCIHSIYPISIYISIYSIFIYNCIYIHTYIHTYIYIYIFIYIYIYIHIYTYIHTYIYIYIHTYTYKYIHII